MSEQIALGFCNNVDYEIIWDADILADLALRYRIGAGEPDARIAIHSERDLIVSILGFMEAGQGGERYVGGSELIERFAARFKKNVTLGGTSVRAAIAMRKLGYRAALHLITQNDDVRRLLPPDCPYVCSNAGDSFYPHLIVQFDEGDRVCAGDIDIRARQSNRLIFHCNADRMAMKLNPDFADFLSSARVLLISGFNAMQSGGLLTERLATVTGMLERLPADAAVFLEDGDYFDPSFRRLIFRALGPRLDVFSLNEDELQTHLQRQVALHDPGQTRRALQDLHRLIPARTIVLHTRYWATAYGERAVHYAAALKAGVTMATTRFRYGDDFTVANYREIEKRAAPAEYAKFAAAINMETEDTVYCVVVAEVEQSKATTIGLGDAFVGGFLPALLS